MSYLIQVLDNVHGAKGKFYRENAKATDATEYFVSNKNSGTRFNTWDRARRFGREVLFLDEFAVLACDELIA